MQAASHCPRQLHDQVLDLDLLKRAVTLTVTVAHAVALPYRSKTPHMHAHRKHGCHRRLSYRKSRLPRGAGGGGTLLLASSASSSLSTTSPDSLGSGLRGLSAFGAATWAERACARCDDVPAAFRRGGGGAAGADFLTASAAAASSRLRRSPSLFSRASRMPSRCSARLFSSGLIVTLWPRNSASTAASEAWCASSWPSTRLTSTPSHGGAPASVPALGGPGSSSSALVTCARHAAASSARF